MSPLRMSIVISCMMTAILLFLSPIVGAEIIDISYFTIPLYLVIFIVVYSVLKLRHQKLESNNSND
jgi:uncharacterized Tic20 family protein